MINWNKRKYTKEEFVEAWTNARSVTQCARFLGLAIYGSTAQTLKATALELGLDREHMTGQSWIKGTKTTTNPARPIENVLVYGRYENSSTLKERLYREKLKQKICEICEGTDWLGKPIPLALDHIDGDRLNNNVENLRILCYNCHGQTDTFCKQKDANGKPKK